jgi:predicted nucleic acid-binding protein
VIVADASVVLDLVLGAGSQAGDRLAEYLSGGEVVAAPHLIDAEVGQGLRRFERHGDLTGAEASSLLQDHLDLPIRRYPDTVLLSRAFELRSNVSIYDGLYLALAEALASPFLTGDGRLREVPECRAEVEVVATSA